MKIKVFPIFKEFCLDTETPITAFLKLTDNNSLKGFLLESKEKVESIGRYSIIGVFNKKILSFSSNPYEKLKSIFENIQFVNKEFPLPFIGGAVGYLSYDTIKYIENIKISENCSLKLPEAIFVFPDIYLVFDHFLNKSFLFTIVHSLNQNIEFANTIQEGKELLKKFEKKLYSKIEYNEINLNEDRSEISFKSNFSKEEFKAIVKKAKDYIYNGDIFQVVLSQRLESWTDVKGFDIYRGLRIINPSPYMFYFNFGNFEIIGSSPEILVKKIGDRAILRPIAGTRKRGNRDDREIINELLSDEKELAEHTMLVDLARNDLGRVCEFNSVKVTELYSIEKYTYVIHIVSEVEGKLAKEYNSIDLFKATFPAGTVSGAPKIRAMEIINELEKSSRGVYAGGVGYFSFSGDMDFCIAIRTIVLKGHIAYVQAGAGIVYDSIPEKEYFETLNKAKALLVASNIKKR